MNDQKTSFSNNMAEMVPNIVTILCHWRESPVTILLMASTVPSSTTALICAIKAPTRVKATVAAIFHEYGLIKGNVFLISVASFITFNYYISWCCYVYIFLFYKNNKKFVIPSLFLDVLRILFHCLSLSYLWGYCVNVKFLEVFLVNYLLKYFPCRVPDTNKKVPTAMGLSGQEKYIL